MNNESSNGRLIISSLATVLTTIILHSKQEPQIPSAPGFLPNSSCIDWHDWASYLNARHKIIHPHGRMPWKPGSPPSMPTTVEILNRILVFIMEPEAAMETQTCLSLHRQFALVHVNRKDRLTIFLEVWHSVNCSNDQKKSIVIRVGKSLFGDTRLVITCCPTWLVFQVIIIFQAVSVNQFVGSIHSSVIFSSFSMPSLWNILCEELAV